MLYMHSLIIPGCSALMVTSYQNALSYTGSCNKGKRGAGELAAKNQMLLSKNDRISLFFFYWLCLANIDSHVQPFPASRQQGNTSCLPRTVADHWYCLPHYLAWSLGVMNFKSDTHCLSPCSATDMDKSLYLPESFFFSLCKVQMTSILPVETQLM